MNSPDTARTTTGRVPIPNGGIMPPMITPLRADRSPDLESIDSLVDFFVDGGATGALVLGSCGENGALSRQHRLDVAARTIERNAGRIHITVGLPALGLADACDDAKEYAAMGADSILAPASFVFPNSQNELEQYFAAIGEAAGGTPLIAYNVPGRTGVTFEVPLLRTLAAKSIISGVKDSSGNIEGHRLLAEATADLEGFARFSGSELAIDGVLLAGFHGAVPGLANPFLEFHIELARRAAAGDWVGASEMQGKIAKLFDLYFHPVGDGSFNSMVLGTLKEGLVQRGVIATSTTSAPFRQVDDDVRAHVSKMLDLAKEIAP